MVTDSNVTFSSQVSGILGLGFPRLSSITNTLSTGAHICTILLSNVNIRVLGTPFIASLVQKGLLSYPLFGLSLTRNDSGTLTLGAVDSTVVTDPGKITLHEVVQFAPFGHERNVSGYLQWAIALQTIYVRFTAFMTPTSL